jgi:hypothetical protein
MQTIRISGHALNQSIPEEIGNVNPKKIPKMVQRAWESKEKVAEEELCSGRLEVKEGTKAIHNRKMMGKVWLYAESFDGTITLVTLYRPANSIAKDKAKTATSFKNTCRHFEKLEFKHEKAERAF